MNVSSFEKSKDKLPKQANRLCKKNPEKMDSLISGALKRHGIEAQVAAAMIVKRANELLNRVLEERFLIDARVVSFQQTALHIVCRHAPARHMVESVRMQIADELVQQFPSITIDRIFCRIDPHVLDSRSEIL